MGDPVIIKRGDSLRTLTDTIEVDGAVFNLTGHTVVAVFKMGATVVRTNATVDTTPTTGKVSVSIPSGVHSVAGEWNYEWEVTKTADNKKVCIPNAGYNVLVVNPNLQ